MAEEKGVSIGQVCVLTRGRNAGKKGVVVDIDGENFVIVDGTNIKRKRRNLRHLLPLPQTIEIKRGATHEEIVEKMK